MNGSVASSPRLPSAGIDAGETLRVEGAARCGQVDRRPQGRELMGAQRLGVEVQGLRVADAAARGGPGRGQRPPGSDSAGDASGHPGVERGRLGVRRTPTGQAAPLVVGQVVGTERQEPVVARQDLQIALAQTFGVEAPGVLERHAAEAERVVAHLPQDVAPLVARRRRGLPRRRAPPTPSSDARRARPCAAAPHRRARSTGRRRGRRPRRRRGRRHSTGIYAGHGASRRRLPQQDGDASTAARPPLA